MVINCVAVNSVEKAAGVPVVMLNIAPSIRLKTGTMCIVSKIEYCFTKYIQLRHLWIVCDTQLRQQSTHPYWSIVIWPAIIFLQFVLSQQSKINISHRPFCLYVHRILWKYVRSWRWFFLLCMYETGKGDGEADRMLLLWEICALSLQKAIRQCG